MLEQWLPIKDYEGRYEVSSLGRVRSLDLLRSNGAGTYVQPGRVLSIYTGDHYAKVRLKREGSGQTFNVHQLVANAFLGECPAGMEVCHGPEGKTVNTVTNLRYDTHSENQVDQARHGVNPLLNRTHCGHGHEWTPENTRVEKSRRRCRECLRKKARRENEIRTARRREAANA